MGKTRFQYELDANVKLLSEEKGQVIGRAEYTSSAPAYLIRYVAGDGRLVEAWWQESAIEGEV